MELEHSFTVAAPVEQAWEVLLDLERIAPCMPGASLTSHEGEEFAGNVRVKLGPVTMTFTGQGRFVERDAAARRMVIEAAGKDKRGGGTARASVRAELRGEDGSTTVQVYTDLVVTGRAAQFGRGMIADVSNRLLDQFTDCLAGKLGAAPEPPAEPVSEPASAPSSVPASEPAAEPVSEPASAAKTAASGEPARAAAAAAAAAAGAGMPAATRQRPDVEPIDLLGVTGIRASARRLVPYLVVFLAGALVGGGIVALVVG